MNSKPQRNLFKRLIIVFVSMLIAITISELTLRLLYPIRYYVWPPNAHYNAKLIDGKLPGIEGEWSMVANSQGVRGREFPPEQSYKILTLGGSTTECLLVDQPKTWPFLLEQKLTNAKFDQRVWVGNVGRSGLDSMDHILEMPHMFKQYPKVDAIIMLIGVNDLLYRLGRDLKDSDQFSYRTDNFDHSLAKCFSIYPESRLLPFYQKTHIWILANRFKRNLLPNRRLPILEGDGSSYVKWREHRHTASAIRDRLPDLTSALQEYEKNLNTIIDLAQQRSIRLIFVTQPVIWQKDLSPEITELLWMGGVGDFQMESGKEYYSAAALAEGMELYNQRLLKVCENRKVECFDLAAQLPKDTSVFFDDCHFNASGADKVSAVMTNYLISNKK